LISGWCYTLTITTSSIVIKPKLFQFELGQKNMADLGESRFLIDPCPFHAKQNDIRHHQDDIPLINLPDDFSMSYSNGESVLTTNEKITSPT
jgi:hypothetical protein